MSHTACGFVAIIGEPNSGKSTLINALVGQKISIITPKAQTTRTNVRGVVTEGSNQLIFIDTPGIFTTTQKFESAMVKAAWSGANDADAVLVMVDATKGITEGLSALFSHLSKLRGKPVFACINKLDKVNKQKLLDLATQLSAQAAFREILFISALRQDGLAQLKTALSKHLPAGPFLYPADEVSDVQLRMLAAEITREKLFLLMSQELPYASLVETEKWEEYTSPNRGEAGRGASTAHRLPHTNIKNFAQELRKNQTNAEQMLWKFLRGKQLGCKFRRQHPFGPYIADFVCLEHRLIIELDGGGHTEKKQAHKDKERTAFFNAQGFEVLRFWNNEFFEHSEAVLQAIYDKVLSKQVRPHPGPPPIGEGAVRISQIIYVQREAHKKMVIGEKGAMIKRIGSSARRELEKMLEKKVHLELFVKVREGWKEDKETFRLLGLE